MLEYKGQLSTEEANKKDEAAKDIYKRMFHPRDYAPSKELVAAVNVAITLNRPLLLTGDPGTGKSSLASSIAWQFGLGKPKEFVVKSDTQASDLFYTFDAIGRFAATSDEKDPTRYIEYQALGKAILYSNDIATPWLRDTLSAVQMEKMLTEKSGEENRQLRSIVLIDEIDKAQRDVPNDVLVEIERREFSIKELSYKSVTCADGFEPIVIITSNSERALPDAFLRRCIYFHVDFPTDDVIRTIVAGRLGDRFVDQGKPMIEHPVLGQAVLFFKHARRSNLAKKPGTAELLDWLSALYKNDAIVDDRIINFESQYVINTIKVCLAKTRIDQEAMGTIIRDFLVNE